ncbi:MAG: phosphatidylinositol-specific phospholipase C domain-containing protein [Chitinophagales bacterium]|nr:phosphatidylinositol-specific phospholipase C domain-containing protein [Chitinophagales bacterium]
MAIENTHKFNLITLLLLFLFSGCKKEITLDQSSLLLPKPYDKVCFLMTHNAMNSSEKGFTIPNQTHSVTNQLKNGVRGLMLDTYDGTNGVALTYHATALLGQEKLVDVMKEIKDFLLSNKKEVITIIFQNDGSNVQLEKAIDSIGLNTMTFMHNNGDTWPTLQTMVDNNQRLVLFVENNKLPRANYLMYAWGSTFDTKYTYKNVNEFDSDVNRGGSGSKELYLVNHWLQNGIGLPDKTLAPQANKRSVISKRVQDCAAENDHFINYLGVDFYEIGDAKAVVDSINFSN